MDRIIAGGAFALFLVLAAGLPAPVQAAPCMVVTLTGTQGGPSAFQGLAGAGTLVTYGDDANDCRGVNLQFDAGRGTSMRLSQVGLTPGDVNAVFITHVHSDHVDGLADLLQLRWMQQYKLPKIDVVCSADAAAASHVMSCAKLVAHTADAYIQSGEIAQRRAEDKARPAGGPADLVNVRGFASSDAPQVVWSSGDVRVTAVRSAHVAGHASYRVDTPAGSVVIGGDAGNDTPAPPRASSTSAQVEALAKGAQVIVHSVIHPVMGPDGGTGFPAPIYHRQSTATDLGAMAERSGARHLMLTHLIPPLGAERQGPYRLPKGALTAADYEAAVRSSGFGGGLTVGGDLSSVRLPARR
jgi:ribonuclease Z